MAIDERLAARVREVLASKGAVAEKKMMGGLAFTVDGAMRCSVGAEGLLVKVRPAERDDVLQLEHVQPVKLGGRMMGGFVRVVTAGLRTRKALERWLSGEHPAGRNHPTTRRG